MAPEVRLMRIRAPRIAKHRKAGQFVIVRLRDDGERIPPQEEQCEGSCVLGKHGVRFLRTGEWEPGTSGPESQASKEK